MCTEDLDQAIYNDFVLAIKEHQTKFNDPETGGAYRQDLVAGDLAVSVYLEDVRKKQSIAATALHNRRF